jgi:ubiquitin C-terminal hydrolase
LSNTHELTKYFLYDLYKQDINANNPLGLGGKLAEAYGDLMEEMWIGSSKSTAPFDLKRVLGKRVARFQGYGQ